MHESLESTKNNQFVINSLLRKDNLINKKVHALFFLILNHFKLNEIYLY